MRRLIVGGMLLLFSASGLCAERYAVKDNGTLYLRLSRSNINRIFIEGDKISALQYPVGGLLFSHFDGDRVIDEGGNVYVIAQMKKPTTLFLGTESGRHVTLVVSPKASLGHTIGLRITPPPSEVKKKNGYESDIKALMATLIAGESVPEGYTAVRHIGSPHRFKGGLLNRLMCYRGSIYDVIVGHFSAKDTPVTLKPEDFEGRGILAVMLSSDRVLPGKTALIYRLQEKGVDPC